MTDSPFKRGTTRGSDHTPVPEKLIPPAYLNALDVLPIRVYGNGGNVSDWLYVEENARALNLVLCLGRPEEQYAIDPSKIEIELEWLS